MGKRKKDPRKELLRVLKGLPDTSPPTTFMVVHEGHKVSVFWHHMGKDEAQSFSDVEDFRRFLKARATTAHTSIPSLHIEHYLKLDAAFRFDKDDWAFSQKIRGAHW